MERGKRKHSSSAYQLKAIAEAYWDFALKNKEYYQLMYGVGMACCESGNCVQEQMDFRKLIVDPITNLISKSKNPTTNPCLKYHTFWSILHGLISLRMMRTTDAPDQLNKLVVADAIEGFIKNLA